MSKSKTNAKPSANKAKAQPQTQESKTPAQTLTPKSAILTQTPVQTPVQTTAPTPTPATNQPANLPLDPASTGQPQSQATSYETAYALEDKRIADAQDSSSDQANNITDQKATKTDGTANVNADKSTPTTEAQLGLPEEVRSGQVEQPHINKTLEERLGLANPDDRLAEELREAKISGTLGTDVSAGKDKAGETLSERQFNPDNTVSDSQAQANLNEDGKDLRTDDITFPDGAQKAQDLKDQKTGFNFNLQEAKRHMALADANLKRIEALTPKA